MIKVGTDFSGIGAPEQALKEMGIDHEVEFACEKDKYARKTYLTNHHTKIMYEDIKTRNNKKAPYVDLYVFGFPCQAFSTAGKGLGFEDIRGSLFFNAADYIREKRPKVFIAENVRGLYSHDKPKGSKAKHGRTFSTIINLLAKTVNGQLLLPMYRDNLGYNVFYTILNSKHYGVPQNRERVFIIGFRDDVAFSFPSSNTVSTRLIDVLEENPDKKYDLNEGMVETFLLHDKKNKNRSTEATIKEIGVVSPYTQAGRVYAPSGIMATIVTGPGGYHRGYIYAIGSVSPYSQSAQVYDPSGIMACVGAGPHGYNAGYVQVKEANKRGYTEACEGDSINIANLNSKTKRGRVGKGIASTLDTRPQQAVLVKSKIRRLTPLEFFRLQGFPDSFFYNSKFGILRQPSPGIDDQEEMVEQMSDTQLYKQAGNSITVKVLKAILKNVLPSLNDPGEAKMNYRKKPAVIGKSH